MASAPSQIPPGFEIPGQKALIGHASIMCVVFVLFLPIAALTVRAPLDKIRVTRLHAPFQVANVILAVVGMGLGSSVATTRHIPKGSTPHILLGYVIVGLLVVVQPVMGILQHLYFRKAGRRGVFGWIHLLLGRIILILGLVNGAKGFNLARDEKTAPYYAVLGVMCAVYVAVLLWDWQGQRYWKSRKSEGPNPQTRVSINGHGHSDEEIDLHTRGGSPK